MEYKFKLDSAKFTKTPEGFLDCVGACARIGNQVYFKDGEPFTEFRPEEEVFSKDSFESHKQKPITARHPDSLVDSDNVTSLFVGVTGVSPRRDGDFLLNDFRIMDKSAVKSILDRRDRGESTEISMGYDRDLDKVPGEFRGKKYDGIQRNIRINHAALLDEGQARAGAGAKLRLDNGNEAEQLALYLLDQGNRKTSPLRSVNIDKTVFKTSKLAKEAAKEFGSIEKMKDERGLFEFIQTDSQNIKDLKTFSVPGKKGISLVFGTLKDKGEKTMGNLNRVAVNVGTFRMDALTGSYHDDSEAIVNSLTTKLDEAVGVITTLTGEKTSSKAILDKLQAKFDGVEKENKKLTGEVGVLSDVNSERVQKMIGDRADLEAVAGCYEIDCKGKTDAVIRDAVILADDKDFISDGKSDDYKQARYDMIAGRAKKDQKAFDASKESFGQFRKNAHDSKGTEKQDARVKFAKKSADAWKTKKAA